MAKNSRRARTRRDLARRPSSNPLRAFDLRPIVEGLERRRLLATLINEFGGSTTLSGPSGIAPGSDGNLWFAEASPSGGAIGRVTPSGAIAQYSQGLTPGSEPTGIVGGSDGALWFTEPGADKIGRITTAGTITEFAIPTPASFPDGIAAGADGNLYFTERDGDKIGQITTSGVITEFAIPTANSQPVGITAGPDQTVWFAESGAGRIGEYTPFGGIGEFSQGITANPSGITAGPDGNLWFTEPGGDKIGRITPSGATTEFSTGIAAGAGPTGITTGPDGKLWFTEPGVGKVASISTQGGVAEYSDPGLGPTSGLDGIVAGLDGNLWFTETDGNHVDRIGVTGGVARFPSPANSLPAGASPLGITAGPDGALWFTESGADEIGRIATSGQITGFSAGTSTGSSLSGITTGPDGAIWFTDSGTDEIGRITPDGKTVTEFGGLTPGAEPEGITPGPDGNLWFAEDGDGGSSAGIGRITPAGVVTEFRSGLSAGAAPVAIVAGPDGALYFTATLSGGGEVGQIFPPSASDPSPLIAEQDIGGNGSPSSPDGITVGPDGRIWFADSAGRQVGAFSAAAGNSIPFSGLTLYPVGAGNDPTGIAPGADGKLYFTEAAGNQVGQVTTAGAVTTFAIPSPMANAQGIAAGPDGNLWFAEQDVNQIGQVVLPQGITGPAGGMADAVASVSSTFLAATFRDKSTATDATNFSATVEFGDGTNGAGVVVPVAGVPGSYDVLTTHDYAATGTFSDSITIGTATGTIAPVVGVVHSASPLALTAATIDGIIGRRANTEVGTFTDQDTTAAAGNFTASIDWGDWTITAGTVLLISTGSVATFGVFGDHTYTASPRDPSVVSVTDQVQNFSAASTSSGPASIAPAPTSAAINEVVGTTPGSFPVGMTLGPDGALWFTEYLTGGIGRIDTSGKITEFGPPITPSIVSSSPDLPTSIVAGPDGNLWFTESGGDAIGRITPAGDSAEFGLSDGSEPTSIAAGPDGNLWFTEAGGDKIGRIDPGTLQVDEFSAGLTAGFDPTSITLGPDGDLWFVGTGSDLIGRITTAGVIAELSGVTGVGLASIAAGPDGDLWFTEKGSDRIGRIDPASFAVTEFSSPALDSPNNIVAGPDGALDFTQSGGTGSIGRITTSGVVTILRAGLTANSILGGLAAGPDGNLYFSEGAGDRIGQVVLPQSSVTATAAPSLTATAGSAFSAPFATFRDASALANPINFRAYIDHGDGTFGAGTLTEDANGLFTVAGSHTYSAGGTYAAKVFIANDAGSLAVPVSVKALGLSVVAVNVSTSQGTPFTAVVADFNDSFGGRVNTSYTATINWGDSTPDSAGLVTTTANGLGNVVVGKHTYATSGPHEINAAIVVASEPSYSGTSVGTASVSASTITAIGTNFATTINRPFNGQVAGFVDTVKDRPPADYSALINWGDGTTSAGTVVAGGSGYVVLGTHTYSIVFGYTVTTTITLRAAPSVQATARSMGFVSPGIVLTAEPVFASAGHAFTTTVASFEDPDTDSGSAQAPPPSALTASINWGDGSAASTGTITFDNYYGSYLVGGTHAYARAGSFPISVTVRFADGSGDPGSAETTATVAVAGPIDEVHRGITGQTDEIAAGPDGALWFTEPAANRIGRVTTSGVVTEFADPSIVDPSSITTGPDDALWFIDRRGVGRITTAGVVTHFTKGLENLPDLGEITLGPDGNLWFTDAGDVFNEVSYSYVDRITPEGTITMFAVGNFASITGQLGPFSPGDITAGPDGNLWFIGPRTIGRITTDGAATLFAVPTADGGPEAITAGPDGALWYTEAGGQIGRVTTAAVFREFPTGLPSTASLSSITTGPDGNLWFTDASTIKVGRITTAGVVTTFVTPAANSVPASIVTGPDRNLWFTEAGLAQVGQVVTPESVVTAPVTVNGVAGQDISGTFGQFADLSSLVDLPSFFTVGVDFGDATFGTGTLDRLTGYTVVDATHAYAAAGTYAGATYLANAVGVTAPSAITARISNPPPPLSFVVTNVNDAGPGSLRQAILDADQVTGATITFAIQGIASRVATITLASPLPHITTTTDIDGGTQSLFEAIMSRGTYAGSATPLVEIDGSDLTGRSAGLYFDASSGPSQVSDVAIFGFGGPAIDLEANEVVLSSFLGLRADGTAVPYSAPNPAADGVLVHGPEAIIGELGRGNVISGNPGQGIDVVGPDTGFVGIFGNIIGLDPTGELARGNGLDGIAVTGGTTDTIRIIGPGNLISGNGAQGIAVSGTDGASIMGNTIGTDTTVARAIGNAYDGILVDGGSTGIAIGGNAYGLDNIISGNGVAGVVIQGGSTRDRVSYNLIGTDITGESAIGNGIVGVLISDSPGNLVGPGDLISGNGSANTGAGVWIDGPGSTGNVVIGDLIGTDISGTRALGNVAIGVLVNEASGNLIGSTQPSGTNIISGNTLVGVELAGAGATGNLVESDVIGADITGKKALGNGSSTGGSGVYIENAPGNTVGGTSPLSANVISGNKFDGIDLFGPGSAGNVVLGNKVGTDITGTAALGNGDDGIVANEAPANRLLFNIVAANAVNGFTISAAAGDVIQGNAIGGKALGNGAFGILLVNGTSGTIDTPNANQDNTLGPLRDTSITPAVTVTVPTKSKKKAHVTALSFKARPMTKLRGLR